MSASLEDAAAAEMKTIGYANPLPYPKIDFRAREITCSFFKSLHPDRKTCKGSASDRVSVPERRGYYLQKKIESVQFRCHLSIRARR